MAHYNIDKDAHYFILTRPMDYFPFLGMFIGKSYGFGYPEVWAEFEVVEEQYKVDDGYKIELRAIDPIYGKETFYQCDFESMVESGKEMKNDSAKQKLNELFIADKAGKKIALVCFCTDESLCHRSIIAGLLQGVGCKVNCPSGKDYSHYYKMYRGLKDDQEMESRCAG